MDVERIFGKAIEVRTPNAVAGTKGTSFAVLFGGEATSLFVFQGTVSFTSTEGSLLVEGNHWSVVRGASPPARPLPMSPGMMKENKIEMRAKGSVAAATLLSNDKPRVRSENEALNQVRTLAQDPQTRAMSQSGAIIKPGSFSVTTSAPPVPAPVSVMPQPPIRVPGAAKNSGQKHGGGGGGPF